MIAIMQQDLKTLLDGMPGNECRFAEGATVFTQGDRVRLVHFVRDGTIHLVRRQEDGAMLILQHAQAGSILAEASVYSDRYHCDARAEVETVTWALARRDLRERLEETSDGFRIWTRYLGHEVQRARLHAEILSLKTVKARLDAWMVWNGDLPEKGRWRSVADEIGVSPEALYRELAKSRREGAKARVT